MARKESPPAGSSGAVHLGRDYLAYVREKHSPPALKRELESRLIPLVRLDGPPPAAGKPFGKFHIEALIGKGGMAEVWLARDPEVKAPVALKVMNDELSRKPDYVRRFLREAANHALVEHENVVRVLELGIVNGRIYFTMELVEGETLRDRMSPGPMTEKDGVEILGQVAAGLLAAHERGLGHRDLKPSNIMLATATARYGFEVGLEGDVVAKIMDFGLARMIADDSDPDLESEGRILGTAKYVAPELLMTGKATLKSDIWAVGVIAYQMFSGRPPFAAKHKEEYLEATVRQQAPPLDSLASVSSELSQVVALMLAKDPAKRPDAEVLVRDFERLKNRRGEAPIVVRDDLASAFYVAPSRGRGSGGRLVLAAGVVGALALAGGVALVALKPRPAPPPRPPTPPPAPVSGPPRPFFPGSPDAPPAPPQPPPPTERLELALGVAPAPLATPLPARFKDRLARDEFRRAIDEGDRAWAASDAPTALARWVAAASRLLDKEPDVDARVARASFETALARARAGAAANDPREELTALEDAARNDPTKSLVDRIETLRARVRALDEVEAAFKSSDALVKKNELEHAVKILDRVIPHAREAQREKDVTDRIAAIKARIEVERNRSRVRELCTRARKLLDERACDTAQGAIDQARLLVPDDPEVLWLTRALEQVKAMPDGMIWVEVETNARAIYARRSAITNREYRTWFLAQGGKARQPTGWPGGAYPEDKADEPVRGVRLDDARAYATSRGDRLPNERERAAIARALRTANDESTPDSKGLLGGGVRTVRDSGGAP